MFYEEGIVLGLKNAAQWICWETFHRVPLTYGWFYAEYMYVVQQRLNHTWVHI